MKSLNCIIALSCLVFPQSAAFTAPAFSRRTYSFTTLCSTPEPELSAMDRAPGAPATVPQPPAVASAAPASFIEGTKQAEYGVSLELPETYVKCGKCQSTYSIALDDLGDERSKGCRLECPVCGHTWFQAKERIMYRQEGFEMIPLPDQDVTRIKLNLEEGKPASFQGEFKLYVGNISFECSEDDLYQVFNEVGPVGDVSMVRDETGRSRGFAFVTMRNKDDGEKSISILDGKEVQGRGIAVRASNN